MVDDDTTGLSDDALRDRLRRLRGESVPEPVPMPPGAVPVPALPAYRMPDLSADGMQPLEVAVSKDGAYDSIRYEMRVRVLTDEARDRVLASIRANGPMHMPAAFPNISTDGVVVTDYDSGTKEATLQAVISLEAIVDASTPSPLLIVGRRDRAEDFARTQGLATKDWRWVHKPRDLMGFPPGTKLRVLTGLSHTPQELEELLQIAKDRGYEAEMVTFGPPSGF